MNKVILILACAGIAGCGNMDVIDYHWTFTKALVKLPDGSCLEYNVKSWHDFDNSDMIQIETEKIVICTHSANVLLFKIKQGK